MASFDCASTNYLSWRKARIQGFVENYPPDRPPSSGFEKRLHRFLSVHPLACHLGYSDPFKLTKPTAAASMPAKSKQSADPTLKRQDSAAEVASAVKPEHCCEKPQPHSTAKPVLKEAKDQRVKNGRVPIQVQIQHCYHRPGQLNSRRTGRTIQEFTEMAEVQTIEDPLEGIYSTQLPTVRNALIQAYLSHHGDAHRNHQHPSDKDGNVLMELYVYIARTNRLMVVTEANWRMILVWLNIVTIQAMRGSGRKAFAASLIARFTCEAGVGRNAKA